MKQPRQEILTPTEKHIAQLLLQGHGRGEIAEGIGRDMKTLRGHLGAMYSKLAIENDNIRSRFMRLALLIHEQRAELGLRCEACADSISDCSPVHPEDLAHLMTKPTLNVLKDGEGIDDVPIVDDLGPQPTSISKQGDEDDEEYCPFV